MSVCLFFMVYSAFSTLVDGGVRRSIKYLGVRPLVC